MAFRRADFAWLDGEFVRWEDAKIHVRTECVIRGISVFEGIRGYWNQERSQLFVFRVREHFDRLQDSMKILRLRLPYSIKRVEEAMFELIRRCNFREDVHIRVNVYVGEGDDHVPYPPEGSIGAFITVLSRPQGKELQAGLRCAISSWRRIDDQSMPPRIKATGYCLNARLAQVQARVDGYDTAIMLDQHGKVSETTQACVMLVKSGVVITPSSTDSILVGITRDTLIRICRDELDLRVEERTVDRSELYLSDEVLECGSGHEITPIASIDQIPIGTGERGPITRAMQEKFFAIVRGQNPRYADWLSPVY